MRSLVAFAIGVALLAPHAGWTATSCPDRTIPTITAPPAGSVKCQATIAKASLGFAKAKLKAMGKCMAAQIPGVCPDTKTTDKINKAAMKDAAKITTDCGSDAVQAGLTNSYGSLTDDTVIGSCIFSQHNATADILLGEINGTPGVVRASQDRAKCVKTLNKVGIKQATSAHKIINKCLATQEKNAVAGNLTDVCVGHWAGGTFTAPTDPNTATGLSSLQTKSEDKIAKDCTINPLLIQSIFACPGAASVADLQACIVCDTWDGVLDFVQQENSETGAYVANGPGALQSAVNMAAPGTKLLIGSGDYAEEVTITTNGLQLVGCGGATNDRPRVIPPATPGSHPQGITSDFVDGLAFQSLEFSGFDENGIFIGDADGVSFRDCDANHNQEYGIFPVTSNNVVVEDCRVQNALDTGIYVGQSTNILVRYNYVHDNVSGIEIENSANAVVENNFSTHNTAGILVFKLPNLPVQFANGHHVFDNVVLDNNSPNASDDPADVLSHVPDGTGILVLSTDTSEFDYNIVHGNGSFGFALVDQKAVDDLLALNGDPPVFGPGYSPDQDCENNSIHDNDMSGNAQAPDTTPPNSTPLSANILFFIDDDAVNGNCFSGNGAAPTFLTANDCP
jgi:parallel beta-helix repeat protein